MGLLIEILQNFYGLMVQLSKAFTSFQYEMKLSTVSGGHRLIVAFRLNFSVCDLYNCFEEDTKLCLKFQNFNRQVLC